MIEGGVMNLTKKLLNNPGLVALTVQEEQKELTSLVFGAVASSPAVKMAMAESRGHKIVFAFFQDNFQGGQIPYWHVTNPLSKSYQSTLSMEGLRQWGVL